jgi:hypothetical protein
MDGFGQNPSSTGPQRNWIGIRFVCHGAYLKVVVPPIGSKVTVKCPVCGREADVEHGPGGSNRPYFEVGK